MAEIYTKPFESVQAAINLFEQKIDPKKGSTGINKEEKGGFLKDLIDCSLLPEAAEHEKNQTFFEFDASSKSPEELFALLKLYEAERDNYKEKFRKSQAIFLEYEKGEHSEAAAQRKTEMMKTELLISSQLSNMEAKKLSSALNRASGEIKFEILVRQFDEIEYMEEELLRQIIMSEYLHEELKQSKEAVWAAMNELNLVKSENEQIKRLYSQNENYILEIEDEAKIMRQLAGEAEEAKTRASSYSSFENSASIDADSNGFCTGITISVEEYEFLIRKSEKIEPAGAFVVEKLRGELEEKDAEISELKRVLEEAERRAVLAEKAKVAVETQLRKWREQRRLRRAASDAVKEYCAVNNETGNNNNNSSRRHEKPLLSKLACIIPEPEPDGFPSHPKRSASMNEGRKSKHVPLGKLLRIKKF